ncbi:MAG: GntR family transcriptional regulator [Gammaproteobacteria bacterium]|jgi:DNA-binding GntR family transcriptional regulator|nr:GntR family transcriptional regulator [Gammaproteobacteria bacterium]MBU0787039.1 GntR family transcriptional regulator [Gammaproteobacteria bacterium]MBU0816290.1 GntR family transcriptional regulator [Gammaproteobacteria bacterium]MBU1787927.1 GntR family transcriptional regulator [Gammaproteobacteria bacterium]
MTVIKLPTPPAALHEQVAQRLRQMLVEGQIAPGAKLNERALAEELSVSRTPLREAIKMLAAEGLVELLPNRGAIAVELTEADILNTFEVMAGLEGQSGELAAQRITDAELSEIKAMHYEMLAAYTRRDLSAYYRLNAAIHRAINAAAKNPVLTDTYNQVNARLQALRFRSNQDGEKWRRAMQEHDEMVAALTAHDPAAMRAVLLAHLFNKRDVVIEQLRAESAASPSGRGQG